MLVDGIKLLSSSTAAITIESGATFPTIGNVIGKLFYKTDIGLCVFDGTKWVQAAGGTPGGSNTQIQYNNNGEFAGSSALTFNSATGVLSATGFSGSGAALTLLNASNLSSGAVPTARLGSGTANSTTYLRGDGTWATVAGSAPGGSNTQLQYNNNGVFDGIAGVTWDSTNGVIKMGTPLSTTPSGVRLHLTNSANGAGIVQGIRIEGNGENYFDIGRSGGDTTSAAFIIRGNQQISATAPVFAIRQYNTEQFRVNFSGAVSFGSSEANFGTAGQFLVSNGSGTAPSWTSNLNASNLSSGTVPTVRLGTGTADSTTYLRGDGTWATVSAGSATPAGSDTQVQYNNNGAFAGSATLTFNSATGVLSATRFSGSGINLTALNASSLTSGTVPTARLGSGTADSTTYLRGDGTWATVSGGSATPGGSTTQVQFNNAGAFAGSANFIWNNANNRLHVGVNSTTPPTGRMPLHVTETGGSGSSVQGIRIEGNSSNFFDIGRDYGTGAFVINGSQDASSYFVFRTGTTYNASGDVTGGTVRLQLNSTAFYTERPFMPLSDNNRNLGGPSNKWNTVYAGTGTINTSDATAKQDVQALSVAELAVAIGLKSLIKTFRFKDAVALKGNDARIHVGVMAQEVHELFAQHGLDAARYGLFCSDTWTDENGVEQTRLGIRYEELLAFIIAAM
jgi:hypothetical protein